MTTQAMGRRWTCECVGGKGQGCHHGRNTWLGRGGTVWTTASPPALLPTRPRWSTGVIMYTLLAGSPPFWHRKQMLMLRMIMSGSYQFGSPEWDDYSDTVKDLVRGQAPWLLGSGKGKPTVGVGVGVPRRRREESAGETPRLPQC